MKVKKVFKIDGMHCASCAMNIEWELEDLGTKAKCSYAKQSVEVEYDDGKINDEKIKESIKSSGYNIFE